MFKVGNLSCIPCKNKIFSKVNLARQTLTRRTEELAQNIEDAFNVKPSKFVYYSIALDENTDVCSIAQLTYFILFYFFWGIDKSFNITEEEMAALFLTRASQKKLIFSMNLSANIEEFKLKLNNLSRAVTDGTQAIVSMNVGVISLI